MGRTDLLGKVGDADRARWPTRCVGAKPGSVVRKAIEKVTGVSSVRLLPPYARQRFTTWFKRRPKVRIAKRQGRVAVFPTCLVEYQQPAIGHDLVKVYERNGIECSLADGAGCCGAPWLHSGDVEQFTKVAEKNVKALADAVRTGRRHRRAAADVRLRAEEGLPRLRRRPRRRAGRRRTPTTPPST